MTSPNVREHKPAVAYTRVSTAEQANEGVSLDAQRERINAFCAAHDIELLHLHSDQGVSGRDTRNRPGLLAALDHACRERAVLVVYSLSRLARSTRDAIAVSERLQRAGAELVSLSERIDTTSASGKLFFRLMSVLSEFESDQIGERVKAAVNHNRRHGKRHCRCAPFGYRWIRNRIGVCQSEQHILARMRILKSEGRSVRDIARQLDVEGIRGRNGTPLAFQQIARLLSRRELHPRSSD